MWISKLRRIVDKDGFSILMGHPKETQGGRGSL